MQPSQRMQQLVQAIREHNQKYYIQGEPSISDAEYDALFDELLALEADAGQALPDSPTRSVGAMPADRAPQEASASAGARAFLPHRHLARLYSLDKCRTLQELTDWEARLYKALPHLAQQPIEYAVEYKLDGLTINLTYAGGELVRAATRGNGVVGEEITAQARTIEALPQRIPWRYREKESCESPPSSPTTSRRRCP